MTTCIKATACFSVTEDEDYEYLTDSLYSYTH
jgi:hypothetical protein